ncbi:AAA family ATPase [Streptomyces sp. AV19]|nr:AAA family ATPase [Streptomyces sp. AV19]
MFTWVDVEEHLAFLASEGQWPRWLLAADGWWDGLELIVLPGTRAEDVKRWLDEAFGAGSAEWQDGTLMLRLDDPRTTEFVGMPVLLSPGAEGADQPRRLPLLREKHLTPRLAEALERPADPHFPDDVQLIAFHSFKGGVGRTVHAVAMADAIAQRGGNVLLVDADLEAPGITWMHRAQGGQLDFCFEDLLALLQGAEDGGWSAAVDIAAAYLPNQQVGRYTSGGRVTMVPTSRRLVLDPPRIEPADLLTPGRSPYFLTEALAALGARTGADTVVVDLRAGASELSAPVLLDPRVQRIFVTTLSHQSLAGTERLLEQLGRRAPALQGVDPASSVIITQYRPDVHETHVERACNQLANVLFASLRQPEGGQNNEPDDTGGVDTGILSQPIRSRFREELLALPSSWDAVLKVLQSCDVAGVLEPIMPTPALQALPESEETSPAVDYTTLRRRLWTTAKGLVYAERQGMSSASGFLVTEPLRRLLGDHRTEQPLALVVGAKGAGKTFMYTRACAAGSWDRFAEQSGIEGVRLDARVLPVLESVNLEFDELTTQDLRDAFVVGHGGEAGQAATSQEIKDRLHQGLTTLGPDDELGWRRLWIECLAMAAGVRPTGSDGGAEAALTELGRRTRAVFVIDGLEDLFQALDNDSKRTALRVLLIEVLAWLRSLRGRPFGLVVFVRQDLVTRAVRQNSGQLLDRYESYALRWDKDSALRLALWVTAHAGALPTPVAEPSINALSSDTLVKTLIPVWGWKMGSAKSREARSHLWVHAALGDFNDQVQARDVVAFLAEAAELSIPHTLEDRVLAPTAMRKALFACSALKINSIQQENPEVGELLARLRQVRPPVTVPLELEQVGISVQEASLLVESGVFLRDDNGRYWVAEIYRHGLRIGSERKVRVLRRR